MLKPQFPSTSLIALHRTLKLQQAETYAVMENINILFKNAQKWAQTWKLWITFTHTWWTSYRDILCEFRVSLQFLFIWHLPRSSSLTARKGLDWRNTGSVIVSPASMVSLYWTWSAQTLPHHTSSSSLSLFLSLSLSVFLLELHAIFFLFVFCLRFK